MFQVWEEGAQMQGVSIVGEKQKGSTYGKVTKGTVREEASMSYKGKSIEKGEKVEEGERKRDSTHG